MHRPVPRGLIAALTFLWLPVAGAQSPAVAGLEVLEAATSVPTLDYRSPFAATDPADATQRLDWRDANDAVARIGGWRAYAREAQRASAVPAAAPPSPPTSDGPAAPSRPEDAR